MKFLLLAMGMVALILSTAVSFLVSGEITAMIVAAAIVLVVVMALTVALSALRFVVVALALVALAALAYGGYTSYSLYDALATTDGPVDPADPDDLAAAQQKILTAKIDSEFLVEMTDDEITALLLDSLQENEDNPLRRIDLTFVASEDGRPGRILFDGVFKNGSASVNGEVVAVIRNGQVELEVDDVDIAGVSVPGVANGALADLAETITDVNQSLVRHNAEVRSVEILDGVMVIAGTVAPPA